MIRWHGEQFKKELRSLENRRVDAAARKLRDHIRQKVSRSQTTSGAGVKKRGLDPSQPGEYPKIVLGHLRRNIAQEHDDNLVTSRVGTNVKYGRFLEIGTSKMQRRPWLSRGLTEAAAAMRAVLKRGRIL